MDNQDNPFIERPDEHGVGEANELYCWLALAVERECNGSCVAYSPDEDKPGSPCMILQGLLSFVDAYIGKTKSESVKERVQAISQFMNKLPQPPEVK